MLDFQDLQKELHFDREAVVEADIYPNRTGRVKFRGSYWPARCRRGITLRRGERCYVVDVCNITLMVDVRLATE
ncbi:MAG: hypothetical protein HC925_02345 [Coleofasciculaceae cyanobacterium SM2_3_26]|nr:hypothetical protein [Coleofasciculaceae cyanobacterium SM2_3_26]